MDCRVIHEGHEGHEGMVSAEYQGYAARKNPRHIELNCRDGRPRTHILVTFVSFVDNLPPIIPSAS